jgi:hypothetical protein
MAVWLLLGAVIQTVSADNSSSTTDIDDPYAIEWQDGLFVVLAILSEPYSYYATRRFIKTSGLRNRNGEDWSVPGLWFATLCSFATVVFNLLKLFVLNPVGTDLCQTNRCAKVVHNCTMTLCCIAPDLLHCVFMHSKTAQDPVPTRLQLCWKMFQVGVCFGYIVYDADKNPAPGPGTTALVVLTCLAELVVFSLEFIVFWNPGCIRFNADSGNQETPEPETRNA